MPRRTIKLLVDHDRELKAEARRAKVSKSALIISILRQKLKGQAKGDRRTAL